MLSIHVITVGRDKERWVTEQIEHYRKLLRKYAKIELTTVPEAKYTKPTDLDRARAGEAEAIRSRLKGGYVIALDLGGKSFSTEEFAQKLAHLQVDGRSLIEFIIGGPHGLHDSLKKVEKKSHQGLSPDFVLSLSPLTMSHQIVRLVLLEQLYRALNLNAGGSYHK
jgi:23S rRNA (pseudouridine1915-N3)-methyltransferase